MSYTQIALYALLCLGVLMATRITYIAIRQCWRCVVWFWAWLGESDRYIKEIKALKARIKELEARQPYEIAGGSVPYKPKD